jgi:hypothetical protein
LDDVLKAAERGNVGEVERLVGQAPGLLDARGGGFDGKTPMMCAASQGHVGVLRWLLDRGAALNERDGTGHTACALPVLGRAIPPWCGSSWRGGRTPPSPTGGAAPPCGSHRGGATSRSCACCSATRVGRRPSTAAIATARRLWQACYQGRGEAARLLLERGADPTIADNDGITPMAIAKKPPPLFHRATIEARRECVAALEVSIRSFPILSPSPARSCDPLRESGVSCPWCVIGPPLS